MAYTKVTTRTKRGDVVCEYHSARYGAPGQKRQKKKKATPEQIEAQNRWTKEKKARIRLLEYFGRVEERPEDMAAAKRDFAQALKVIRREYKKRGAQLYWMRNIEVGTKNGCISM